LIWSRVREGTVLSGRHFIIRLLALAAIAYAMACGGGDGIVGETCTFSLVITPEPAVRGQIVEVAVNVETDLSGTEVVDWSIDYAGAQVAFDVTGANGDEVTFTPAQAGVYNIVASGSIGVTQCDADFRNLNVTEPGAMLQPMRLVVVPRSGSAVPPQTIDFQLPGGAPYTLSTVSLDSGTSTTVYVWGPTDALEGAYLRAMPTVGDDPALWIERFSQAGGAVNLDLANVAYDVLVVPDGDLPAVKWTAQQPDDLAGVSITADNGVGVTGTVADPAGDPLAGARVQVTVDGAPSTVGTTNASGAFTLKARAGEEVSVVVTPPDASGLPQLERVGAPPVASGSTIAVRYAAGLEVRTVSPVLRQTDGTTPAAGARVTFLAHPNTSAGSIAIDGGSAAATGTLVRTAQANASGVIAAQTLTSTQYDVVVEPGPSAPPGERVRFAPLDLRTGQSAPTSLRLATPGHFIGQVVDAAGAPVEGAHLFATPQGLLTRATTAGDSAVTGADGSFNLAVAAKGLYQIRIDGPQGDGRALLMQNAPDAPGDTADLGDSALPATLVLTGSLTATGGAPVASAALQLQCLTCGPGNSAMTVAEAVSDTAGDFIFHAPDPGVAE
jgi:hypothetical protein